MTDRTLRPMSLGDVFDEGFDLYKKNLLILLLTAAVVAIPLQVIQSFVLTGYLRDIIWLRDALNSNSPDYSQWSVYLLRDSGLPILAGLVYAVELCGVANCASARYLGEPSSLGLAYRDCARRLPSLILCGFLYQVIILLAASVCLFPTLWPIVGWVFAPHTFILEKNRPAAALRRSAALVRDDSGRIIGCLLMLLLIGFTIYLGFFHIINFAVEMVLKQTPGLQNVGSGVEVSGLTWRDRICNDVATGISMLLLTPFCVCVLTVLYFDVRVRKEAFDIELLAKSLGYPDLALATNYLPAATAFQPVGYAYGPPPGFAAPRVPPPAYRAGPGLPQPSGYSPPPQAPPTGYVPSPPGPAPGYHTPSDSYAPPMPAAPPNAELPPSNSEGGQ